MYMCAWRVQDEQHGPSSPLGAQGCGHRWCVLWIDMYKERYEWGPSGFMIHDVKDIKERLMCSATATERPLYNIVEIVHRQERKGVYVMSEQVGWRYEGMKVL